MRYIQNAEKIISNEQSASVMEVYAVLGTGSTVYGWVDAKYIAAASSEIAVGSKVKVRSGAKTYTGKSLASFVYKNTYTVLELKGDRAVIGVNGVVTAAVNVKDITLVWEI